MRKKYESFSPKRTFYNNNNSKMFDNRSFYYNSFQAKNLKDFCNMNFLSNYYSHRVKSNSSKYNNHGNSSRFFRTKYSVSNNKISNLFI